MVTFIPPYLGEEIKSNAEKKMFEVLQELQMENVYILHSLGLPKHQSKIYGEIDFVVVCNRGVACLEIKGGRVACKEGKWLFTDRYGVEREKPEGPFAQVIGNMFSLKEVLKKQFPSNSHMKNILLACGVVFPDIAFTSISEEIIPEIIYDNRTAEITTYLNTIFDYWESRQHRETSKLSPRDINEIVAYLRNDFCFVETLSNRLNSVERKLIRLTSEQVQIMHALSMNERLLIEGGAGTGKTMLAMDFAISKANSGNKVLYLTYNKNLSNNIQRKIEKTENLTITNIHAFFGDYVSVDIKLMERNPQLYFSEVLPEKFYDFVNDLTAEKAETLRFDYLVMDEGQDILKPIYLYSLDLILEGGLDKGKWVVFYDENQNIYNPEYCEGMELLQSYNAVRFKLFTNCRNTVQIGNYSAKVSGIDAGEFIKENGEEVQRIFYNGKEDFSQKIKEIIKYLKQEQIDLKEVVFLAPKKYKNSMLADTKTEIVEISETMDVSKNCPRFSTIQGFKGLDAKIVILIDIDDIKKEHVSRFLYIAGTRARTLLYVFVKENT